MSNQPKVNVSGLTGEMAEALAAEHRLELQLLDVSTSADGKGQVAVATKSHPTMAGLEPFGQVGILLTTASKLVEIASEHDHVEALGKDQIRGVLRRIEAMLDDLNIYAIRNH